MPVENGMWQSVTMQFPRFLFLATNPNSIVEAKGKKYKRKQRKKGQSGKLAQPEQQQQQHTFGTGCS